MRVMSVVVGCAALIPTVALADVAVGTARGAPSLSGPRIGVTYIVSPSSKRLKDELGIQPVLSQFGWQFEYKFFEQPGGFSGLNEFAILLGGLDQATLAPTISWLLGVRSFGGTEFGGGPVLSIAEMAKALQDGTFGLGKDDSGKQLSMAGVGFALAAGVTLQSGDVHFPLNLVLTRSRDSYRLSLLVGFTLSDDEQDEVSASVR